MRRRHTFATDRINDSACPTCSSTAQSYLPRGAKSGFTLVEVLVATAVTLLLMASVATMFAFVSENVTSARSAQEMRAALRAAQMQLQRDLQGATAPTLPPLRPEDGQGYLEIKEGPIGPIFPPQAIAVITAEDKDIDGFPDPDMTVGDLDDWIALTTRSQGEPFVGRYQGLPGNVVHSQAAEVIWFLRGTKLYRRVILVKPGIPVPNPIPPGWYSNHDVSVREVGGGFDRNQIAGPQPLRYEANTLGDLTNRANRYGHQPYAFPHDARTWGALGMPTLAECTYFHDLSGTPLGRWPFPSPQNFGVTGTTVASNLYGADPFSQLVIPQGVALDPATQVINLTPIAGVPFDAWQSPYPWVETEAINGTLLNYFGDDNPLDGNVKGSTRISEDLILDNVLSFDVKVWDPGAPIFSDTTIISSPKTITPDDPGYVSLYLVPFCNGSLGPNQTIQSFGAYVDLNYCCLTGNLPEALGGYEGALQNWESAVLGGAFVGTQPRPKFAGPGDPRSCLAGQYPVLVPAPNNAPAAVYDTGSMQYEYDGRDQDRDGLVDEGTNGIDDDFYAGVDDRSAPEPYSDVNFSGTYNSGEPYLDLDGSGSWTNSGELEAPPPYAVPLRGVQIKIRALEPDSRQVVEITIYQDFLPE